MSSNLQNVINMSATVCLILFAAKDVHAHVVLEQKAATAGSYYRAAFMVGHGCNGSPTTGFDIEMPEPMAVVKPMPKPGWELSVTTAVLAKPLWLRGKPVNNAVSRVAWSGGLLADGHYDEFVILLQLPVRAGPLYFRVAQICETGRNDWVEIPEKGQKLRLKMPAAVLDVVPATQHHHH